MGKFIDLTGMRFGRLVVLKRSPDAGKGFADVIVGIPQQYMPLN